MFCNRKNWIISLILILLFTNYKAIAELNVKQQTLQNNLSLYSITDTDSAMIHLELVIRAGYNQQSADNAGFFLLYNRLFFTAALNDYPELSSIVKMQNTMEADCSRFTADLPVSYLQSFLSFLSQCLCSPSFSDNNIKKEYDYVKTICNNYAYTTSGFINTAIDNIVFNDQPWKTESGIYPSLFNNYSIGEVRTILSDIGQRYYTPDNSALFITGPVTSDYLYQVTNLTLDNWTSYYNGIAFDYQTKDYKKTVENNKYVLVDPYFSPSFTQLVVQYTDLLSCQSDILSAAFNSINSPYKAIMTQVQDLAILSKDYLACSTVQKSNSTRLIFQALMQQSNITPVQQSELFVELLNHCSNLDTQILLSSKNSIISKYNIQKGSSIEYIKLLSSYWALNKNNTDQNVNQQLNELLETTQEQKASSIYNNFISEKPFIFVLVNSSVYEANKQDFQDKGYICITKDNAGWYLDQLKLTQALNPNNNCDNLTQTDLEQVNNSSLSQIFLDNNLPNIQSFTLNNNIPVTVKQTAEKGTITISLKINGGEAASPVNQKGLRTILINYFALNIQNQITKMKMQNLFTGDTKIYSKTLNTQSYITINCLKQDYDKVLLATVNAIIFGEITPLKADRLVYEQKGEWSTQDSSLTKQLKYNAFEYLYRNTPLQNLFDDDQSYLSKTTYNSIERAYAELLDASLYSFVIAGDTDSQSSSNYLQESFGLLMEQHPRVATETYQPQFKNKTRNVQLKHTYTTDKDASEASVDSPILVPTSDFNDPVLYLFQSPQNPEQEAVFNLLLSELTERIQKKLNATKNNNSQSFYEASNSDIKVGILGIDGTYHTNIFLQSYKAALQSLDSDLKSSDKEVTDMLLEKLKQCWVSQNLMDTQTNEGWTTLLQQSINQGSVNQIFNTYQYIEALDTKTVSTILKTYFSSTPQFIILSVDSKK